MADENLYTFENPDYKKTYWHTCSHVLAQAMKRLHPEVKLAIGPAIENGFYYDFDTPEPFSETQLAELEAEMRKICKEKLKLERFELPRAEAVKFMEEREEPCKVELINDLPEDATISSTSRGVHRPVRRPPPDSTGRIKGNGIKLTACNAAYWRGTPTARPSSGSTASPSPRRSSWTSTWPRSRRPSAGTRKLELGFLFMMAEKVPFFLPKGMVLKNTLLEYWRACQAVRLCGDRHPHHPQPGPVAPARPLGPL